MPQPPPLITRFAPSPTGYLHLGHVASALCVWGLGRARGAQVLLRIEDHDRSRWRLAYEEAIFADLAWLGLIPDNRELRPGVASPYRQSDCVESYEAALTALVKSDQVYGCDCTRAQILARAPQPSAELRYDGYCRTRGLPLRQPDSGLRLLVPHFLQSFADQRLGTQTQCPAEQCGDLLIRDRHGLYTYNFAVAVDDLSQGISLVIRGEDVLHATGRQIWLASRLGREQPAAFYHHPLIVDNEGVKLSKRFRSDAIAQRREAGESAEVVLGEAAFAIGLTKTPYVVNGCGLASFI